MDRESAVSRNVIFLIIAVFVVLAIVVVAINFITRPSSATIPALNATVEVDGNTIYIYHDSGDPVNREQLRVLVNRQEVNPGSITLLHAQEWPWTTGKTMKIVFTGQGSPELVQLIYRAGSDEQLILSRQVTPEPGTTLIPVTTAAPTVPGQVTAGMTIVTASPTSIPAGTPEGGQVPVSPPGGLLSPGPPVAAFSGTPLAGAAPLQVSFTDRTAGVPDSWSWAFGDGLTSTEQNPAHQYGNPGTYTVSLTVTNRYGVDKQTKEGYVSAGTTPSANFAGTPRAGQAPLGVEFTDLSTGSPTAWRWQFGDGSESSARNPIHVYAAAGSYPVSLSVTNAFGGNTRIQTDYVTVTASPTHDMYLTGSSSAVLLPDGYLQFRVSAPGSWIKSGGTIYDLAVNDTVQMILTEIGDGNIDGTSTDLSDFYFDNVRLYINGQFVKTGIISELRITGLDTMRSTLIMVIPADDAGASLMVDGNMVPIAGKRVTVINLKPDSWGRIDYSKVLDTAGYRGGAEGYTLA